MSVKGEDYEDFICGQRGGSVLQNRRPCGCGGLPACGAGGPGADVAVVLPLYQKVKEKFSDQLHFECYDYVDLAWRHSYCGLFSMERDGVTWYFLDNEQYFQASGVVRLHGRRRAVRFSPGPWCGCCPT